VPSNVLSPCMIVSSAMRRSFAEARRMQGAGADCLFLRSDFVQQNVDQIPVALTADSNYSEQQAVFDELLDTLSGNR
jgi:hypothetical protein